MNSKLFAIPSENVTCALVPRACAANNKYEYLRHNIMF